MNKFTTSKSRTALFLMELIIAILFFSIASAVCMQLFAKAHLTSVKTQELNKAVALAQSYAETFKGTDGSMESLNAIFPEAETAGDCAKIYYDNDFNASDAENAAYLGDITITSKDAVSNITIVFTKLSDNSEVYRLTAAKYRGTL